MDTFRKKLKEILKYIFLAAVTFYTLDLAVKIVYFKFLTRVPTELYFLNFF